MKYLELQYTIKKNIFTFLDVLKFFPEEKPSTVRTQLSRLVKRGLLTQIKRGLYALDPSLPDELELANRLYSPSYISLETALNYYGIIPDIPAAVTSVTTTTTKKISNDFGNFYFMKIKPGLFWGYVSIQLPNNDGSFSLAEKEKALLDFFYIRRVKDPKGARLDVSGLDMTLYRRYAKHFPAWVRNITV